MLEQAEKVKIEHYQKGKKYFFEGEFFKKTLKKNNGKGEEYFVATIKDNSGIASQQVWQNLPLYKEIEQIENGAWVRAEVECTNIDDRYTNIKFNSIEAIERPVELIADVEALTNELRQELVSFEDPDLKALVTNVFRRPEVAEAFFKAPASQKSGYSHDSGLLTHVVRLIRLCKAVANVFNTWDMYLDNRHTKLNVDLLKTACFLHDVGKVLAFKKNGFNIEKTDEGKLFEDSYLSMRIILQELDKVNLPEYQRMLLEHVIGSSKGQQRFGALYIPRSREAVAFHFIEALDVQMANFEHLDRDADVADLFSMMFDKQVFLGLYEE